MPALRRVAQLSRRIVPLFAFATGCAHPQPVQPARLEGAIGWLTVVWNGKPQVFFTDSLKREHRLVAPDSVINRAGGIVALNGHRVRIWGTPNAGGSVVAWKILADSTER